jgi:hypothetical protein
MNQVTYSDREQSCCLYDNMGMATLILILVFCIGDTEKSGYEEDNID